MPLSVRHRLTADGMTLLYAGFASFRIITSDGLLSLFIDESSLLVRLSVIKGIAFGCCASSTTYPLSAWRSPRPKIRPVLEFDRGYPHSLLLKCPTPLSVCEVRHAHL